MVGRWCEAGRLPDWPSGWPVLSSALRLLEVVPRSGHVAPLHQLLDVLGRRVSAVLVVSLQLLDALYHCAFAAHAIYLPPSVLLWPCFVAFKRKAAFPVTFLEHLGVVLLPVLVLLLVLRVSLLVGVCHVNFVFVGSAKKLSFEFCWAFYWLDDIGYTNPIQKSLDVLH